jgi:3-hydroxymyristoyl/3-hydroxydecanoyl-(acyl carrier protein) dehydratase
MKGPHAHFAAFSFVDRITELDAARRAVGRYDIPATVAAFPSCLVAEAVGQLAAWVAMAHIGFRGRPVAALAHETRFRADVAPGDTLSLAVDIESCDEHAVAYSGSARVGGSTVIELIDCLGPMLPVEEFDSPEALAGRFELIRGSGAKPGAFHGVVPLRLVRTGGEAGRSATATLHVPEAAPFFGDHFPRRPVFPATLLLDAQIGLAMSVAREATHWGAGKMPVPARMTHVKVRSFTPPGAALDVDAELAPTADGATIRLSARMDGKVAATARLDVVAQAANSTAPRHP